MAVPISLKSSQISLKLTVLMQHQHIKALKLMENFTSFSVAVFEWVSGSSYTAVSLKLLVSHIAVSLGETFSGPNGFSNTPSSSSLSCCNSRALNSSNPSNASARCWYDEVSNRRCRGSNDDRLETTVAGFCSEQSLPFRGAR